MWSSGFGAGLDAHCNYAAHNPAWSEACEEGKARAGGREGEGGREGGERGTTDGVGEGGLSSVFVLELDVREPFELPVLDTLRPPADPSSQTGCAKLLRPRPR
jgi:hypothetical protein